MMTRFGFALLGALLTTAANAQAPIAVPGSGNSATITNTNREQNAGYNRVVGQLDPQAKEQPAGLKGKAIPANAEDLKAGSPLRDKDGIPIGAVSAVDAEGVIVDTGTTKIRVPAAAFGKDEAGLLLGISKAQFAELVAGAK
jgi:hypothetical protein